MTTAKKLTRGVQVGDLIKHKAKTLDVDFGGTVVQITYNPALLTVDQVDSTDATAHAHADALCTLITDWPLSDDKGDIPVGPKHTAEVIRRVHYDILRTIFLAIVEDNTPDPTSARS